MIKPYLSNIGMIISGLILATILSMYPIGASWIYVCAYFLLVPGFILSRRLTKKARLTTSEMICASVGLSILLLISVGIAVNALHYIGITSPLRNPIILTVTDFSIIILLIYNRKFLMGKLLANTKDLIEKYIKNYKNLLLILAISALPLVSTLGAISLNNGGSNLLTMLVFLAIALIFILFQFKWKELSGLTAYFIYASSAAILLSISMRGNYITGHDIQSENFVFTLTNTHGFWDMDLYNNAYNACLSLNIFPTMISQLSNVPDLFIFKIIFQAISSLVPVIILALATRLYRRSIGVTSAFLYLTFPTFINDMAMLNRQGVAFLFFALILLFTVVSMRHRDKFVMTVIFTIGLIVSHYSTSYVSIGLFVIAWIIYRVVNRVLKNSITKQEYIPFASIATIVVLIGATMLWNITITKTSRTLEKTVGDTLSSLINRDGSKSWDTQYGLFAAKKALAPQELLDSAYGLSKYNYIEEPSLKGHKTSAIDNAVIKTNEIIRSVLAKLIQLFVLVGVGLMMYVFKRSRRLNALNVYVLSLVLAFMILLFLQMTLPKLSVYYGTLRFFQQALIVSSIPMAFCLHFVGVILKKDYIQFGIPAIIVSFMHLDLTGWISQITGNYAPQLALNNYGIQYDAYYIHRSETTAKEWLLKNNQERPVKVAADNYARLRFVGSIEVGETDVDLLTNQKGVRYIYNSVNNVANDNYFTNVHGNIIRYQPAQSKNSPVIYSTGSTNITYADKKSD